MWEPDQEFVTNFGQQKTYNISQHENGFMQVSAVRVFS